MSVNPNASRIHGPYKSSSGNRGVIIGVIAVVVLVALAILVWGVFFRKGLNTQGAPQADPISVVNRFFTSIQSKNWSDLNGIIYLKPKSSNPDESNPDYIVQHDIRPLFDSIDITSFAVKKSQINGDKATVWTTLTVSPVNAPVSIKPVQTNPSFGLVLVDGQWKISTYFLPKGP